MLYRSLLVKNFAINIILPAFFLYSKVDSSVLNQEMYIKKTPISSSTSYILFFPFIDFNSI